MQSYLAGLGMLLSLIVAIGAQNAFVLKQGLLRQHVLAVALFCALSDALLIVAGVAGAGVIVSAHPGFLTATKWGGALFLFWYGLRSFRAAWVGGQELHATAGTAVQLGAVLSTAAALTWLNPHVYLDTLILLGAVSAQAESRWLFALGAVSGSLGFFLLLGFGARLLAPVFARPIAWRVLDALVGAMMWLIAWGLVRG
ncbi:LysE/ArgO family amino acid transporter [Paracoccus aminophilus]|uniref:Lysine exporter protein n=1 Tax=Paracoccus aminophilus JCM 7686 TaxID=1367847 RepID=S5XL95_PARAH|nr:LysE/ArgO family amino acid transporter [Paracoccus aminophilus]AGT07979.1 lysine exporter protein [Paracoccus aminophilus JCM 7686]